jgi:hypothetical protein
MNEKDEIVVLKNMLKHNIDVALAEQAAGQQAKSKKYKVREYALYYYYIHQTTKVFFENHKSGKLAAIKEVAAAHGISEYKFQQHYNKIANRSSGRQERLQGTRANITHLENTIIMLQHHPSAKSLAEADLKIATSK